MLTKIQPSPTGFSHVGINERNLRFKLNNPINCMSLKHNDPKSKSFWRVKIAMFIHTDNETEHMVHRHIVIVKRLFHWSNNNFSVWVCF